MSDTSQGPGWWLASDGKWYPPELWTGPPESRPGAAPLTPPTGPGPGPQGAGPGPTPPGVATGPGAPVPTPGSPSAYPGQYPGAGTGYGKYPSYGGSASYGAIARKKTNGLAVAAFICAIAGFLFFLPAVLGVVFGFVARSQIRRSGGTQGGDGLALAAIVIGFAWLALIVIVIIVGAANNTTNGVVLGHLAAGNRVLL